MNEYPCQQLLGGSGAAIYSNEDGLCDHPECNPQNNNNETHTLNACLARVIGREIFKCVFGVEWTSHTGWGYDLDGKIEEWDPLQNASQLEEVEAWVIQQPEGKGNTDIYMRYEAESKRWIVQIVAFTKDNESEVEGIDPDKKRAFALAVQAMEQSQKEVV